MKKIPLLVLLALIMFSCSNSSNIKRQDVEQFMNTYFEDAKENDFALVQDCYSESFYQATSVEKWEEMFTRIHEILGEFQSTELDTWNVKTTAGTNGSGTTYTFVYSSKYENGDATETVVLYVPRGSEEIKIQGHNFKSDAFIQ